MAKSKILKLPVQNYYGTPYVEYCEKQGKHYLCLEGMNDTDSAEISEEFYNACIKEFADKE